jgi:PTH1 family peptidyl-tRNA hydrolase
VSEGDRLIILGLGNPDPEYLSTRHNVGFMVVQRLAAQTRIGLKDKTARSRLGRGTVDGREIVLALPQTFMNLSGRAATALRAKFPAPLSHLWVVHDELDLPFGRIRIRRGGGSAGHQGVESLIADLGSPAFVRFRVGVGRPPDDAIDHVISPFSRAESEALPEVIDRVTEALQTAIRLGLDQAMTRYNRV